MSNIEWTEKTWNPVIGCAKVSPGCKRCYAETMAKRIRGMSSAASKPSPYLAVLTEAGRWNGRASMVPERLAEPLRWRKPVRVFVNSMSDLFHEDVTFEYIAAVFGVMAATPRHTYQILTKRPARMLEFFEWASNEADKRGYGQPEVCMDEAAERGAKVPTTTVDEHGIDEWPLPNVWIGVSTEDQATADERIPLLQQAPAAVRFLSCEPLLGPIDLAYICFNGADSYGSMPGLDWIIVGGESGTGARPCDIAWIRKLVWQCEQAGVACFVKQLGASPDWPVGDIAGVMVNAIKDRKGADPDEWPEDLRVRQYPEART